MWTRILLLLLLSVSWQLCAGQRCEPLERDSICGQLGIPGYNFVSVPEKARQQHFLSIVSAANINSSCHPLIMPFLCTTALPLCHPDLPAGSKIRPCLETCESVRTPCDTEEGVWPSIVNCQRTFDFHSVNDSNHSCITVNQFHDLSNFTRKDCNCYCPFWRHGGGPPRVAGEVCPVPCNFSSYLGVDGGSKSGLTLYLAVVGLLSSLSSSFVAAVLVLKQKYKRIEQQMVLCMIIANGLAGLGCAVRYPMSFERSACSYGMMRVDLTDFPVVSLVVFTLVYLCGLAGVFWWVGLALSVLLTHCLKWDLQAICRGVCSRVVYGGWCLPAGLALIALLTSALDADPFSGLCSVGNLDSDHMLAFLTVPQLTALITGTVFLALALAHTLAQSNSPDQRRAETDSPELANFLVFSLLFAITLLANIGCQMYEVNNRVRWVQSLSCPCARQSSPNLLVFYLKYTAMCAPGMLSGVLLHREAPLRTISELFTARCGKKQTTRSPAQRASIYLHNSNSSNVRFSSCT